MTYELALRKAWDEIVVLASSEEYTVHLFTDIYEIKITDRIIQVKSSGTFVGNDLCILILHYLIGILKHGYKPTGEWVTFKELWGGFSYYPAFQKNTIIPILERFKRNPDDLIRYLTGYYKGRIVEGGDISVEITAFLDINIRLIFWVGDEELPPELIIQFSKELAEIVSTEDIAVLMLKLANNISSNEYNDQIAE